MPNLFLCYASRDKDLANKLVIDLRNAGISVWLDKDESLLGHDTVDDVYDGIRNSQFFALLLTPELIKSTWLSQELDAGKVKTIEKDVATIIPLLLKNSNIPEALKSKEYIDFRDDYENGLNQLIQSFPEITFPKDIVDDKLRLEETLLKRKETIEALSRLMLTPQQDENNKYKVPEHYSDENIKKLKNKIIHSLNLLDHLISIEDSKDVLLKYYGEARELSSMILNYKRESLYFIYLLANSPLNIHNLIMQGIANVNAGLRSRSIESFRKAIRLFFEFQPKSHDNPENLESSLIKFVYTVTRHIRIELTYAKPFRDLIIFKDKKKIIDRLEKTMDCLDAALEKESIFSFKEEASCFNYGKLLATIGLTKRALTYLAKAKQLGSLDSEFEEAGINIALLEEQTEKMATTIKDEAAPKVQLSVIQFSNFFFQFGYPPQNFEDMIKNSAPDFYKEIIEDYDVFEKSKD